MHVIGTAPGNSPLAWRDMWECHMEGATRTGQSGTTHFFLAGCEIRMGAPLSWAPKYEVLPRKAQGIIVSGVATEGKLWDR